MTDIFDNLVDLQDHCLLCFREDRGMLHSERLLGESENRDRTLNNAKENGLDGSSKPNLCKRFLKSLSRYLRLPLADLMVVCENEQGPRRIQHRWEDLITGIVCQTCKEQVESFCDLYTQREYMDMQLRVKMQELEQCIHFTDQETTCSVGKSLLKAKWESNLSDSQYLFQILDLLRKEIVAKATNMTTLPLVSILRIPDPENNHPKMATKFNKDSRQSSTEDSGVSMNSGLSPMSSCGEEHSIDQFANHDDVTSHSVPKEYKVMRRVFTCKRCGGKFFNRDKLTAHYMAAHSKSSPEKVVSVTPTTPEKVVTPVTPEKVVTPATPETVPNASTSQCTKVYKLKKTPFVCPAKDCGEKFLRKEVMLQHMEAHHPSPTPPDPSTNASMQQQDISKAAIAPGSEPMAPAPTRTNESDTLSNRPEEKLESSPPAENGACPQAKAIPAKKRRPYSRRAFNCAFKGCLKKFHFVEELLLHAQFHRSHQCSFCSEILKGPETLALHEYSQHRKGPKISKNRRCPRCPDSEPLFPHYRLYLSHFYANHLGVKAPEFKCSKCNTITISRKSLEGHEKRCHQNQSQQNATASTACTEDPNGQSSNSTTDTSKQPAVLSSSSKYACNICSLSCTSFAAYQTHLIARHDPNIQFCSDCERMFKDSDSLHKHRAYIHLKFKVCVKYCKFCERRRTFKSIVKYNAHMRNHEIKNRARQDAELEKSPRRNQKRRNLRSRVRNRAQRQPEKATGSTVIDNENRQPELLEGEANRISLEERVKLGLRRRSGHNYTEIPDDEEEEQVVQERNLKKRRMRRRMIRAKSSNTDERNDAPAVVNGAGDTDANLQPAKRKVSIADTGKANQTPTVKAEIRSPAKLPKLQTPVAVVEKDSDSCSSTETVILEKIPRPGNNSSTPPTNKTDRNSHEFPEPMKGESTGGSKLGSSHPGVIITQRVQNWMVANNIAQKFVVQAKILETEPLPSSSKQSVPPGAQKNANEITDCIDLVDGEDEKGNLEHKPDPSRVDLGKRVNSWLSDREPVIQAVSAAPTPAADPSDVEVITLD